MRRRRVPRGALLILARLLLLGPRLLLCVLLGRRVRRAAERARLRGLERPDLLGVLAGHHALVGFIAAHPGVGGLHAGALVQGARGAARLVRRAVGAARAVAGCPRLLGALAGDAALVGLVAVHALVAALGDRGLGRAEGRGGRARVGLRGGARGGAAVRAAVRAVDARRGALVQRRRPLARARRLHRRVVRVR